MPSRISGARTLSRRHVSIRVPWHDGGWDGSVCRAPTANTSCTILVNIGEKRDEKMDARNAGRKLHEFPEAEWPPCVVERATFMAGFEFVRTLTHPYATASTSTHGHFRPTKYKHPPYSAPAIPFAWLRRDAVEGDDKTDGLADRLQLGFDARREPVLDFDKHKTQDGEDKPAGWINERRNQLTVLDTFFSAVEPGQSLCFFYAKRTPLAPEDGRRVIVGVGLVTDIGEPVEYESSDRTQLRAITFERNVAHSIRPGFENGFVFPYQAVLAACDADPSLDPASFVAFVPDEHRPEFSYVTEHVSNDAAIAALVSCARALERTKAVVPGPWDACLAWVDRQLNLLWRMRGPSPGFGSALTALGVERGTLVAHAISLAAAAKQAWNEDPWEQFEAALTRPTALGPAIAELLGADLKRLFQRLPEQRKALIKLLSRFELTNAQATRFYQETERKKAGIEATDSELIENPYLLYELDRAAEDSVGLLVVDRGLFPDAVVRDAHPLPAPSALEGPLDRRRMRAFVIDALERAAAEGHTLQRRGDVISSVREREVRPAMPMSADLLAATEEPVAPFVSVVMLPDGSPAFQLDRFVTSRQMISNEIAKRRNAKRHQARHRWAAFVDRQFEAEGLPADDEERRARAEKAAALEELFSARIAVLLGQAGTGKTTLLKALCALPEVEAGGVLLLAPTGKARVRLETQTGRAGGKTIAQFLLKQGRYDAATGRYFVTGDVSKRHKATKTVIIDECSMLTEEQLAAVLDALSGVERLILVGDPRQLPPIGSGRPFVDIVEHLAPDDVDSRFPRVAQSYAELTVSRRQKGADVRDDLSLAQWFSGRSVEAAGDEVWERVLKEPSPHLRLVRWNSPAELHERLLAVVAEELKLPAEDENAFEESLGAAPYNGTTYFHVGREGRPGAAAAAERWQILSPVRAGLPGVDAMNQVIQDTFRKRAREWATTEPFFRRKVPPPIGPQCLLYGDKVISVVNRVRRHCWPKQEENPYVANGDLGIIVGAYRAYGAKFVPKNLEVEFVAHAGIGVKYFKNEFGDEGLPPLELAYALTVHKTQGSEFDLTFVILPSPCRLLSRELLYTALTRQRQRVVLFHQGDLRELLRYSDAAQSEIARRSTNLFEPPRLVRIDDRYLEERLIHRTARGERVRSKSELVLADKFHHFGIEYEYERPFVGADGSVRLPDFTMDDPASGRKVIWEHLGMLTVPAYRKSWDRKLAWYAANGVLPGGGPNGMLVTSEDSPTGGLDSKAIDDRIREVFSV